MDKPQRYGRVIRGEFRGKDWKKDMFTGIIEELGVVKNTRSLSEGIRLAISGRLVLEDMKIGDSIAVNGACLTVVETARTQFSADVSRETMDKTTIGKLRGGDKVNLERPMRMSDRLGGHLVAGHVDGIGIVRNIVRKGDSADFTFETSPAVMRYLVYKGSVAIDGISLTVNEPSGNRFSVTIIPHTLKETTLGFRKTGDQVNLEADMIGKYVEKFYLVGV